MKETQMPPADAANLEANNDNTAYVVESIKNVWMHDQLMLLWSTWAWFQNWSDQCI